MDPTSTAYRELQEAFAHFNDELFEGKLPPCLLTLQREKRTYGYFSSRRFTTTGGQTTDEIALNPEYFGRVTLLEVLQTIVHEMVHLWQYHFGKPGRVRYHNAEWGQKMESIGLMPSSTGEPGGRRVGDSMADYPIKGGRFLASVERLVGEKGFGITWYDRRAPSRLVRPSTQEGLEAEVPTAALQIPMESALAQRLGDRGIVVSFQDGANGGMPTLSVAVATDGGPDGGSAPGTGEGASEEAVLSGLADILGMPAMAGAGEGGGPGGLALFEPPSTNRSNRVKYVCGGCGIQVWGKPKLKIGCMECSKPMQGVGVGEAEEKEMGRSARKMGGGRTGGDRGLALT